MKQVSWRDFALVGSVIMGLWLGPIGWARGQSENFDSWACQPHLPKWGWFEAVDNANPSLPTQQASAAPESPPSVSDPTSAADPAWDSLPNEKWETTQLDESAESALSNSSEAASSEFELGPTSGPQQPETPENTDFPQNDFFAEQSENTGQSLEENIPQPSSEAELSSSETEEPASEASSAETLQQESSTCLAENPEGMEQTATRDSDLDGEVQSLEEYFRRYGYHYAGGLTEEVSEAGNLEVSESTPQAEALDQLEAPDLRETGLQDSDQPTDLQQPQQTEASSEQALTETPDLPGNEYEDLEGWTDQQTSHLPHEPEQETTVDSEEQLEAEEQLDAEEPLYSQEDRPSEEYPQDEYQMSQEEQTMQEAPSAEAPQGEETLDQAEQGENEENPEQAEQSAESDEELLPPTQEGIFETEQVEDSAMGGSAPPELPAEQEAMETHQEYESYGEDRESNFSDQAEQIDPISPKQPEGSDAEQEESSEAMGLEEESSSQEEISGWEDEPGSGRVEEEDPFSEEGNFRPGTEGEEQPEGLSEEDDEPLAEDPQKGLAQEPTETLSEEQTEDFGQEQPETFAQEEADLAEAPDPNMPSEQNMPEEEHFMPSEEFLPADRYEYPEQEWLEGQEGLLENQRTESPLTVESEPQEPAAMEMDGSEAGQMEPSDAVGPTDSEPTEEEAGQQEASWAEMPAGEDEALAQQEPGLSSPQELEDSKYEWWEENAENWHEESSEAESAEQPADTQPRPTPPQSADLPSGAQIPAREPTDAERLDVQEEGENFEPARASELEETSAGSGDWELPEETSAAEPAGEENFSNHPTLLQGLGESFLRLLEPWGKKMADLLNISTSSEEVSGTCPSEQESFYQEGAASRPAETLAR